MARYNRILLTFAFVMSVALTFAQNRYVVYFADKNSSPYKISEPETFLSSRAISRRIRQEIAVTTADLPVNPSYLQQLTTAGAKPYFTSRWLNCALVQTTPAVASSLSALSFVTGVVMVAPGSRLPSGRVRSSKGRSQGGVAEATRKQLEMLGIDDMQADHVLGEGVMVAVLDAGFMGVNSTQPFEHLYNDKRVVDVHDFVFNTKNIYQYDDHGTEVLSVMAASSDTYTGGAYEATFQLYVTEDVGSEYRIEEYNWLFAAERADSSGVDIIHTSLGYNTFDDQSMDYSKTADLNGKVAVISKAAQAALDRGIVVVCSAGNEGNNSWGTITPPADVKDVIAVGAITSSGARSPFSSFGPTSDGRIKPDVMALGSSVSVVKASGANGFTSGTSLAAPIVTSLVAGLVGKFPELDPNEIARQVVMTASQASSPDNLFGYGIPNYYSAKAALEGLLPLEEISIYPNPTDTGKFSIRFKQSGVQATITVYDLNGKILSSHEVNITAANNPIEIDVADLPGSSYLVKVKTNDNFKAFRLVKL